MKEEKEKIKKKKEKIKIKIKIKRKRKTNGNGGDNGEERPGGVSIYTNSRSTAQAAVTGNV